MFWNHYPEYREFPPVQIPIHSLDGMSWQRWSGVLAYVVAVSVYLVIPIILLVFGVTIQLLKS